VKFIANDKGLEIKYSWKERFTFFFLGRTLFNRKSAYLYYTHMLHLISEGVQKSGDFKEHGPQTPGKEIQTK
tara:strand:+ start:1793 stop:2008 length:216 start_codon:yes stop_codon:yes gene_type:complete